MTDIKKYTVTSDYAFHPIKKLNLIKYYKDQQAVRWVPADIDLSFDKSQWLNDPKCTDGVKKLVIGILSFFVPSDGLVTENIFHRFQQDTSIYKEATAFYAEQGAMEMVHSETYSLMADSIITDEDTRYKIYNSFETYKSVRAIRDFMVMYMSTEKPLLVRILAFACIEGILFNSAFACVHWIKLWKNILPGFCKANEFIARDESIHTRFACELFNTIANDDKLSEIKLENKQVYDVIQQAVELNKQFISEILPESLIGLTSKNLDEYTKCTANKLCESLGYEKLYPHAENPFDWMKIISLPNRTNFFESKVSEYAKPENGENNFDMDEYF